MLWKVTKGIIKILFVTQRRGGINVWGAFIYLILVTVPLGIYACFGVVEFILRRSSE